MRVNARLAALGCAGIGLLGAGPAKADPPSQRQINAVLAVVDRSVRDGLSRLADTYPDLRKTDAGPLADALGSAPQHGNGVVAIGISHYNSMAAPIPGSPAAKHGFNVTVILHTPAPSRGAQAQGREMLLYPALNLAGGVGAGAADPKLNIALKQLVTKSLAPVEALEEQAEASAKTVSQARQ